MEGNKMGLGAHPEQQLMFAQLPPPTSPLLSTWSVGLAVYPNILLATKSHEISHRFTLPHQRHYKPLSRPFDPARIY